VSPLSSMSCRFTAIGGTRFIVACGYKGDLIKRNFKDFNLITSDFTVSLRDGSRKVLYKSPPDWNVSLVDTGVVTMTGGRPAQAEGVATWRDIHGHVF